MDFRLKGMLARSDDLLEGRDLILFLSIACGGKECVRCGRCSDGRGPDG